jgi:hypothetical protein
MPYEHDLSVLEAQYVEHATTAGRELTDWQPEHESSSTASSLFVESVVQLPPSPQKIGAARWMAGAERRPTLSDALLGPKVAEFDEAPSSPVAVFSPLHTYAQPSESILLPESVGGDKQFTQWEPTR